MELTEAIKHAIDGNALLFLGSGFSVDATPIKGDKFLTGRKLATHLYKECGITPPNDELNYAAQRYEKKYGAERLVRELQELFTASEVHPHQERFSEINWKSIYTTNYDDVLEKAFAKRKIKIKPVTPEKDTREFTSNKNICVHINGYIDTLTADSLNESFKLTNTSYLTESFSKSKWSFLFRRTLETSRVVIFVGYSLYDIDIQRIIYSNDSIKEKIIFIEPNGIPLENYEGSVQEEFGRIFPIGIDNFWKEYDKISKHYDPQKDSSSLFAFDEIIAPESISDFRYDNIFDLLFKGEHKLEHIWNCVHNSATDSYFIVRNHHDMAIKQIEGGMKNIIVHSDVANGKTMFLLGLACRLLSNGYRVFWLKDDVYDVWEEVNYITSLSIPIVIIIENFSRRTEELKYISLRRSDTTVLISSAKTSLYETVQDELVGFLEPNITTDIDLNKLDDSEVHSLNSILRKYQLWGERDDWHERRQEDFIKKDCEREFSSVLLEIIKSPNIQEKFSVLFKAFHEDNMLTDVIVTASVLKLLGFNNPSESMISELIDSSYLRTLEFKRNPIVKQLLTLSGNKVVPRSSIIAIYGLTSFSDTRKLIERLVKITENAHYRGTTDRVYFDIYRDMVNYGNLQKILPSQGKRDAVIRFYEKVKNLSAAQNHPHFLLQYAIARLSYDEPEDLGIAKRFLDSAYAQAKRRSGYHTRHMDNVKARYLIKHSITLSDIGEAMKEFTEGHQILLMQARTEKSESPYKVAQQYLKFYNDKKSILTAEYMEKIKFMSSEILDYIYKLDENLLREKHVKICQNNLESLVRDISLILVLH